MSGIFLPLGTSTGLLHTRRGRGGGGDPPRLRSGSEDGLVDIWCPLFLFQLNLKRIHGHTRSQERVLDAEDYNISLRLDRKAHSWRVPLPSCPGRFFAIPSLVWVRKITPMAETWIRLLGPPRIESPGTTPPQPKGRSAWAVLAYPALQPDGVSRSRTATLLFPDAADPLGALRWNLSELRRSLDGVSLTGDPLRLTLPRPWHCDAPELVGSATGTGLDPRRFDGQLLASDTAHYGDAVAAFAESQRLARAVRNRRQQAFSEALLGRVHLLRGDLELAAAALERALDGVAAEHWTAFEPFVAGVRGETYPAASRMDAAADLIGRTWVMAELAGDHCHMALAAGAEARLFLAHGDLPAAEHWIDRGLEPKPWYLWYTVRLLDVAAEVTIAAGSPRASQFVERLAALSSRSGMREFVVRAQSHRAALGDEAAAQAVPWPAKEIDNPALTAFLARRHGVFL